METTLHRELKEHYMAQRGGRCEVVVGGYRIDAVGDDGELIEAQNGPLGALKGKLRNLLPRYRIRVVKPVVLRRRITRRNKPDGPDISSRWSPLRGDLIDVFDDLVGLAALFPHENLNLDILGVSIEETRTPRRRRPGYRVVDRRLIEIVETLRLTQPRDLWEVLPPGLAGSEPFTTRDLARKLGRPLALAQRVAYCLRLSGAVETVGKRGNNRLYQARDETAVPA